MRGLTKIAICLFVALKALSGFTQCITSFPNIQDFETTAAWTTNGVNTDWVWGIPSKPSINSAAIGSKCWIVGGLSGLTYNSGEKSYIESPCYNFSTLTSPYVSFKIFWETEYKYDGASLLYSTNNGATWNLVGSYNDPANCMTQNWYNYNNINFLAWSNTGGWSGNSKATTGSCQGGNGSMGWVTAKHCLSGLAGQTNVKFRFNFGSGTSCNSFDGFAIDDFTIANAGNNLASFTHTCSNFSVITPSCANNPSYHWNFGDLNSGASNTSTLTNPTHNYTVPGIYTVSLTTTGGPCNAIETSTQLVSVIGASITASTAVSCFGGNNGNATATGLFGNSAYTYTWLPFGGNGATATALTAGNYTVLIKDMMGCGNSSTVSITEPSISTGASTKTITNCMGDNLTLDVATSGITDPITYLWLPGSYTINSITVSPLSTTIYSVNVVIAGSCPQSEQKLYTVVVVPKPVVASENSSITGCAPLCVNFTDKSSTPQGTITNNIWSFNTALTTNSVNPTICFNLPGVYKGNHSVTNSFGCTSNTTNFVTVNVYPTPIAQFEADKKEITELNPLVNFKDISTTNPTKWEWNFDGITKSTEKNTNYHFNSLGAHSVLLTVSNAYGCSNTTMTIINVLPEFTFFVPNTFSPNDDGLNDLFLPEGMGWDVTKYKLVIYNRWGQKLFHTEDYTQGWNGKKSSSSEIVPNDVYIYTVELMDIFKKSHQFTGHILVIN